MLLSPVALGLFTCYELAGRAMIDLGIIFEEVLLNFLMWLPVLLFEVLVQWWMARQDAGFHEALAEREREFQRQQAREQREHEEALMIQEWELNNRDED